MSSNLRIEPSTEDDLPRLMDIVVPAFESIVFSKLVGATNTPENKALTAKWHAQAWREHADMGYKQPFGIKCVHTDPTTGQETIVSSAEWVIYDRPRTEAEYTKPAYLFSADWVEDEKDRKEAQDFLRPALDARIRWMGGQPHALLSFMATDERFRGQGAAKKCVQWGMDRCKEIGCPAILEASELGKPVYESLGWEVVETIMLRGWAVPILIWWPPGWKQDKKPVLPGYGL